MVPIVLQTGSKGETGICRFHVTDLVCVQAYLHLKARIVLEKRFHSGNGKNTAEKLNVQKEILESGSRCRKLNRREARKVRRLWYFSLTRS